MIALIASPARKKRSQKATVLYKSKALQDHRAHDKKSKKYKANADWISLHKVLMSWVDPRQMLHFHL